MVLLSTAICKNETFLHLSNLLAVISFIYFFLSTYRICARKKSALCPVKPELLWDFFLEDLRVCMKSIRFPSSSVSESRTHSCKVQWDCCLISVQLYSQIGKSLADKGTHQIEWLTKGRALFPSLWNPAYSILSISLCVFPNQSKSCQQKWQRLTDFYPIMNQEVCLGTSETSCSPRLTP